MNIVKIHIICCVSCDDIILIHFYPNSDILLNESLSHMVVYAREGEGMNYVLNNITKDLSIVFITDV